jgi:hypothetical protein
MKKTSVRRNLRATEAALQRAILEYLNYNNVMAWRVNSGLARTINKGKKSIIRLAPAGTPDIVGVMYPTGRALFVEVKRPGKKPTDTQLEQMQDLSGFGALCVVATSVDEVKSALEGINHKLNERTYERTNS